MQPLTLDRFVEKVVVQKRLSSSPEHFDDASPLALIEMMKKHIIPPIMTVHGTLDTLVPVEDSREFHYQLKIGREATGQSNVKDVYIELPGTTSFVE